MWKPRFLLEIPRGNFSTAFVDKLWAMWTFQHTPERRKKFSTLSNKHSTIKCGELYQGKGQNDGGILRKKRGMITGRIRSVIGVSLIRKHPRFSLPLGEGGRAQRGRMRGTLADWHDVLSGQLNHRCRSPHQSPSATASPRGSQLTAYYEWPPSPRPDCDRPRRPGNRGHRR